MTGHGAEAGCGEHVTGVFTELLVRMVEIKESSTFSHMSPSKTTQRPCTTQLSEIFSPWGAGKLILP
jgi:hypothetical protein